MATNKNITMKQFNGVDYDTLYPKTIASQIDDVYSKSETSNLFLPKAGGSMGGILDMNGNKITNLPSPSTPSEPATKEYVDNSLAGYSKIVTLTDTTVHQVNVDSSKILEILCVFSNFNYDRDKDADPVIKFYSTADGSRNESISLYFFQYYSSKFNLTNASFAIKLIPTAIDIGSSDARIIFASPYRYNISEQAYYYMQVNTISLSVKEFGKINGTVDIYMKLLP